MKVYRVCPIYYPHIEYGGSVIADYTIDELVFKNNIHIDVITCSINNEKEKVYEREIKYYRRFGNPIYVKKKINDEEIEKARKNLENEIKRLTKLVYDKTS